MKSSIWGYVCLLLFLGLAFTQEQPTRLTFFIEHEQEQEEDFIEVTLQVEAQSRSLVEAVATAKRVAADVGALATENCKANQKKGKGDCKQAVDISTFSIEPKYQIVRKQSTFATFVVSHDVTINVYNPENIGQLIDSLLKFPELTLEGFEWQPLEEQDSQELAIEQGLQQGEVLCNKVGLSLGRVLTIEEIIDDEEEPAAAGGDEQEEQEEEAPEITTYKFEVECQAKKSKK